MGNLPESSTWEIATTQIDTGEELSGGVSGVLNRSFKQLTNRTKYLYDNSGGLIVKSVAVSSGTTNIDLDNKKELFIDLDINQISTTISFSNIATKCFMRLFIHDILEKSIILPSSFNYGAENTPDFHDSIILECCTIDGGTEWHVTDEWNEDFTKIWTVGGNTKGQLGLRDTIDRLSLNLLDHSVNWNKITASCEFTLAIKTDGTLWSWGSDYGGQLGLGNNHSIRLSPVQVGSLTDWDNISGGYQHSLAIKTDGTLWSWGGNSYGELGQGNRTHRSSPVQVGSLTDWDNISGGREFTLATKTDGTLWSWGRNDDGQLGQGHTTDRISPVQVGSLTDWDNISGGYQYSLAIKTDGTLWAWGRNSYGQLGQGNITHRSSPVQVGSLTDWRYISAGCQHTLAIKTDGTLWSWGRNTYGQLGSGNRANRSSPVQVGNLTDWKYISAGCQHTLAIKTDGTLWSWGRNDDGQLGSGNTTHRSSPVQVGSSADWDDCDAGWNFSMIKKI